MLDPSIHVRAVIAQVIVFHEPVEPFGMDSVILHVELVLGSGLVVKYGYWDQFVLFGFPLLCGFRYVLAPFASPPADAFIELN